MFFWCFSWWSLYILETCYMFDCPVQVSWRQPLWDASMEHGLVCIEKVWPRYELLQTQILLFSLCTLYEVSSSVYSLSVSLVYAACVWIISMKYTYTCMSPASRAKLSKSFFLVLPWFASAWLLKVFSLFCLTIYMYICRI